MSFLGLSQHVLDQSALMDDFGKARVGVLMEKVKQSRAVPVDERLAACKALLNSGPSKEQEKELQVGATALSDLETGPLFAYLVEEIGRLDRRAEWRSLGPESALRRLVPPFGDLSVTDFGAACRIIAPYDEAVEKLPEALVKTLAKDYVKVRQVIAEERDGGWPSFVDGLFAELCVAKSGLRAGVASSLGGNLEVDGPRGVWKKLYKIAAAHVRKLAELSTPYAAKLAKKHDEAVEAKAAKLALESDGGGASECIGRSAEQAPQDRPTAKGASQAAAELPDSTVLADLRRFQEGDKVTLLVTKNKAKYEECSAVVLKQMGVTRTTYKVRLESGPQIGEVRIFSPCNLRLAASEPAVPPAGTTKRDRSGEQGGAEDEMSAADANRAKSEANATALFGSLDDIV